MSESEKSIKFVRSSPARVGFPCRRKRVKKSAESTKLKATSKENGIRKKVIKEIISSEETYLKYMNILVMFFIEPCEKTLLLSAKELSAIFGDIRTIIRLNSELLSRLKSNESSVGKAFFELAPFLKLYSMYANNYQPSNAFLQKVEKTRPALVQFRQNQESRPEVKMKLSSLLIMPVQRIPRYKLLLEELLMCTDPENTDYVNIKDSLQRIQNIANHINGQLHNWDNMHRMLDLQRRLVGNQPNVVVPGRHLVKEGLLWKMSRKNGKYLSRWFFLFNDMLIYCKNKKGLDALCNSRNLVCSCILPVKHCCAQPLGGDGNRQQLYFQITCLNEVLKLSSDNYAEGQDWIVAVNQSSLELVENRKTLRKESTLAHPIRRPLRQENIKPVPAVKVCRWKRKFSPSTEVQVIPNPNDPPDEKMRVKKPRLQHRLLGIMTVSPETPRQPTPMKSTKKMTPLKESTSSNSPEYENILCTPFAKCH